MDFEFRETTKLGGTWAQQYVILRYEVIFLRMVGDGTRYRLMTETAEEAGYKLCRDGDRLRTATTQWLQAHKAFTCTGTDRDGRPYVFTEFEQPKNVSDDEFTGWVNSVVTHFFAIYDALG